MDDGFKSVLMGVLLTAMIGIIFILYGLIFAKTFTDKAMSLGLGGMMIWILLKHISNIL